MKKAVITAIAVVLTLMLLAACADKGNVNDSVPGISDTGSETTMDCSGEDDSAGLSEESGILSAFSTTDINGSAVDQSILADYKLTMVNVWATYCSPCLREMPDLGELAAEYKDKGVQIVGLVVDTLTSLGTVDENQVELARDIADSTGAAYTHLLPTADLNGILDQIYAVPTTFFINSAGERIGDDIVGSQSREEWIQTIDDMLAEAGA